MASRAVDSQQTLVAVPVMMSVSIPRACRISCNLEEPGTKAPKRVLSTIISVACTSSPGHNAKPWQSLPKVSIIAVRRCGEAKSVNQLDQLTWTPQTKRDLVKILIPPV